MRIKSAPFLLIAAIATPLLVYGNEISKFVLIKMSKDQAYTICREDVYTQCMGFTEQRCMTLADKAIDQCLGPLPDQINLANLQNDQLEACPKAVYAEAGFTEEKAEVCFDKAAAAAAKSQ